MHFVFMGVSGSGKTTVAERVARELGLPFAEADAFHPRANIDKMAAGTPLTDGDRWPWLRELAGWIAARTDHFMPPALLRSQLETLEPLEPDEAGREFDVRSDPDVLVREALAYVETVLQPS